MGACSVTITDIKVVRNKNFRKNLTKKVSDLLDARVKRDREYNGHREGYSGDWQTIGEINYHDSVFAGAKPFKSLAAAEDWFWEKRTASVIAYRNEKYAIRYAIVGKAAE